MILFLDSVMSREICINEISALVKVRHEDLMITSELQKRSEEVQQAYREGKCVTCSTQKELEDLLDSL